MVAARKRFLLRKTAHLEGAEKEEAIAQYRVNMVSKGGNAAHMCNRKVPMIIGVRYQSVPFSIEDDFSMKGPTHEQTLWQCRQAGLEPFFLTATLGTTGTCAVDRFDEVSQVLQDEPEIWVHVDAAYAGSALVCEEHQHLTADFEAFDSFSMVGPLPPLQHDETALLIYHACTAACSSKIAISSPVLYQWTPHTSATINPLPTKSLITVIGKYHSHADFARSGSGLSCAYGLNGFKAYIRNHIVCADLFLPSSPLGPTSSTS